MQVTSFGQDPSAIRCPPCNPLPLGRSKKGCDATFSRMSQRSKVSMSCACAAPPSSDAGSRSTSAVVSATHCRHTPSYSWCVTCRRAENCNASTIYVDLPHGRLGLCYASRLISIARDTAGLSQSQRSPRACTCAKLRWSAASRLEASSFSTWCSMRYTRRAATGPWPSSRPSRSPVEQPRGYTSIVADASRHRTHAEAMQGGVNYMTVPATSWSVLCDMHTE